ncbi:MAG: YceI family protein [Actinobacteria bacterium]|nr:YceI family protein [Actinomycetota bacterium]
MVDNQDQENSHDANELGTIQFPAGTWAIDQSRSVIGFSVRHLLISTVRGHFDGFSGEIVTSGNPIGTSVEAYVEVATLQTGDSARDIFILSRELLDTERWPRMWMKGEVTGETSTRYILDTEMCIRDVVRPVQFEVAVDDLSIGKRCRNPSNTGRVTLHARATVNRKDFNLKFSPVLESGGIIVADTVDLRLDISATFDHP